MALSRFWSYILILSIGYIFIQLVSGKLYSLTPIVNGKQNELLLLQQLESNQIDSALLSQIQYAGENGYETNGQIFVYKNGIVSVYKSRLPADGIFATCKNTIMDIWLPLIGYLTFFCGLLNLLSDSNATEKIARLLTPFFVKIFPELPKGHEAYGYMTMNFAANFLGLDNAATPFGLKAMESMQEVNPDKTRASNSQIMFLCLHAAGLTLIPTSIIGYRAAQYAENPADIMLPTIMVSFTGTMAALVFVSIKQRINLINPIILGAITMVSALIGLLLFFVHKLNPIEKLHTTGNISNAVLLGIILLIVLYASLNEKFFIQKNTNLFDSFVHGAKDGFTVGLRVLPYMIAMLVALSIFRNSGLMNIVMEGLGRIMGVLGVDKQIIDAIPVALMRPFSAGGSRGFMIDAMKTYGADSVAGRLSCLFQGAAETTFYVIALYFGSVSIKETRYTLGIMLLVDLVCVLASIAVVYLYF